MPRYYFDFRDNGSLLPDHHGLEFDGIDAVRSEATGALAQRAKDVLPGCVRSELGIEVRDEANTHVLEVWLRFEVSG